MERDRVNELHYIAHMKNLPSILARGILNHTAAARLRHVSIAMNDVQELRAQVVVPGGLPLHEYANLYFSARNPMMYVRRERHQEICVLRIDPAAMYLPGAIVTDGNASSGYTAFYPSPEGLSYLDDELVFARSWQHSDEIEKWQRKRVRCAEILVPERVGPELIMGAYVSCDAARLQYVASEVPWEATVNSDLFFR